MSALPKYVGLTGPAGAGKDFIYRIVKDTYPDRRVERVAFADEVKRDLEWSLEVDIPSLYRKPYSKDIRKLLQFWGTDYRREENDRFWIERVFETWDFTSGDTIFCFTDVRFVNEVETIKDLGGVVWYVEAPKEVRAKRLGVSEEELESLSSHATEKARPENADGVIENGGRPFFPKEFFTYLEKKK